MEQQQPHGGSSVAVQRTFLDDVIDSIMTPGASPGLVAAINGSLLLLVVTLIGLIATGTADVHTGVMLFLALGLLASVNWFISMVRANEAAKATGLQETQRSVASDVDAAQAALLHGESDAAAAATGEVTISKSLESTGQKSPTPGTRRRRQA